MKTLINRISISYKETIRNGMIAIDKGAIGIVLLIDIKTREFKSLLTDGDIRRGLLCGHDLDTPLARLIKKNNVIATTKTPFSEIDKLFNKRIKVIPILDEKYRVSDLAIRNIQKNFPVAEPTIGENEFLYVEKCLRTAWISSKGKFVKRFEEDFAAFCNSRYALAVCNGTAALHLAFLACGIGFGDEVIVPTLTFIATANAVSYTGAKPIFVDVEPQTWTINPQSVEQAITKKTRAIVPVHLYGHPADMDPLKKICKKYNLALIEDAAEAHGATYKNQRVGSIGDIGIFSFFGNKILSTGEGGMIVTDNDEYKTKLKILRDHGMDRNRPYWHPVLGYNYRLTNVQAAIGVAQIEKIDQILLYKQQIASWYTEKLLEVPGISLTKNMDWAQNVYWLYSILIDEENFGMSRDDLIVALQKKGIETKPVFYPLHLQPIYKTGQCLPVAEKISLCGLSLPSSVKLNKESINQITETIIALSNT